MPAVPRVQLFQTPELVFWSSVLVLRQQTEDPLLAIPHYQT